MDKLPITYRGTVYPWHCDQMGHMNVMWYTGKFDEASWQFLSHLGLTRSVLRESNIAMAAVQQNISYKRELYAGDLITIRTGILEFNEKTIKFIHRMENNETGEIAAEAELTGVCFDALTRKSKPLSDEFRNRARRLLTERESPFVAETLELNDRYAISLGSESEFRVIWRIPTM